MSTNTPAIHNYKRPVRFENGKWTCEIEKRQVVLMATSGAWAMVKQPRAMPYVAPLSEIDHPAQPTRASS